MQQRIIEDISKYIFVSDELQKVDAIFLPGGSHPEQPEYAAKLFREMFRIQFSDDEKGKEQDSNGVYKSRTVNKNPLNSQEYFYEKAYAMGDL